MSIDMFPDSAVAYLLRHAKCEKAEDHGPQCPDRERCGCSVLNGTCMLHGDGASS